MIKSTYFHWKHSGLAYSDPVLPRSQGKPFKIVKPGKLRQDSRNHLNYGKPAFRWLLKKT